MQRVRIFFEFAKALAVIALGLLYFAAVGYLVGFIAAQASYPTWEHAVLVRHAFGEFTILALGQDFLHYIIPALFAAYLTGLFRPARWLVYSLLLIGPYAGFTLVMFQLHSLPAGVVLYEPSWEIVYWILSSVLLYGLLPAALWLIYKIRKQRATAQHETSSIDYKFM
ncbi:MAG TPA: hypothetical protein VNI53_09635 [Gammaproteobacteria bacterium]|nr:hypothetical protein [Gammaproteobacteria bacterium]